MVHDSCKNCLKTDIRCRENNGRKIMAVVYDLETKGSDLYPSGEFNEMGPKV